MFDVVTTSFLIKTPVFDREDFERYSSSLFDEWDRHVETHLRLSDYALTLVIEEGSIKGSGKIAATAAVLYFAIGSYGDFISGIKTIQGQATFVANVLFENAKHRFQCSETRGNKKQSGGEIFYLKRLFDRVQHGDVTADQAIEEIRQRWGEDVASSPEFLKDLASSLASASRYPEQLSLSDNSWEPCIAVDSPERQPRPRTPRAPETPIPQQYRIEITRSSKGDEKRVKLTKVK